MKPLQGDSAIKWKALDNTAYFTMMTSFLLNPAYYMAAYKGHQSIDTKDKTTKMLSLLTKTTELAWKSRPACTGEQHFIW